MNEPIRQIEYGSKVITMDWISPYMHYIWIPTKSLIPPDCSRISEDIYAECAPNKKMN